MLNVRQEGSKLCVETAVAAIEWDTQRGGEIASFVVSDGAALRPVLPEGRAWPDLQVKLAGGTALRLAESRAELKVLRETPGRLAFQTSAVLGEDLLRVDQQFEVFEEGAVFCDLVIQVGEDSPIEVTNAAMELPVAVTGAKNVRWGYYSRHPWNKYDPTCVHVFSTNRLYLTLDESAEGQELFPLASLDLGWEGVRFYSNHLEFLLEDWTAVGDGPREHTHTQAGMENGCWRLRWDLYNGPPSRLATSYRYRNRWGLLFGRARTEAGAEADPACRNNIIGSRISHCMYPYVREGREWPWAVMPIKQTVYQDAQSFVGFPGLERVDEVADAGANMMIIHQFWMSNPGSNGEPPADYRAADPKWLKAFVDRCHERGMRVAPYIRGTEMYSYYSSFFEEFFQKDWDGLYMDWTCPLAQGWVKASSLHFSAYNYFMFMRALRHRVGDGGFLIGHTGNHAFINATHLDVCLAGEFSVMHEVLLADPQACAYYALLSGCGGHLLGGDTADRRMFASPKATAYCAALGMTSHSFLSPGKPFKETAWYMFPLWAVMARLSGPPVRVHNPGIAPTRAVQCDQPSFFPVVFQAADGQALVTVANLGETADGAVKLDLAELALPSSAHLEPLDMEGVSSCQLDGHCLRMKQLPSESFCAALIR